MKIIGCDFHPGYQQIAMLDMVTGEMVEKALSHERKEEVRAFYAGLEGSVRVGIEASGQSQWFERMLAELGHEVWIGDAAKIRASCERKQKTDRRDAELLLKLLAEDRFPRIWVPTAAERDGRQLLLHRHKLVRMRTQVKNQLQALALNQGVQRKWKLWSEAGRKQLESLPLLPWASRRRAELLQLLDQLEASIAELDRAVAEQANGAASGTAIDDASGRRTGHGAGVHADDGAGGAFCRGKQVASYLGLIPSEHSSGGRQQRLGHISKQGNPFLRGLLVEAAQSAVRHEPEMRRAYQRLAQRKCRGASESGHGTEAGSEVVLDAALASGLRAADPGFACRTARHILWSWLRPAY